MPALGCFYKDVLLNKHQLNLILNKSKSIYYYRIYILIPIRRKIKKLTLFFAHGTWTKISSWRYLIQYYYNYFKKYLMKKIEDVCRGKKSFALTNKFCFFRNHPL